MLADYHGLPVPPPWLMNPGTLLEPQHGSNALGVHADFLDLPGVISHWKIDKGKCLIQVQAEQVSIPTYPDCDCPDKEVKSHTPFVMHRILDTPRGRKRVVVDIKRRRWQCKTCGKTMTQPLDCMAEGHYRMTRQLLEYVQVWSLLVTELSLSEETGVFVRTIREIREQFVDRLKKEVTFGTPRVLGLDGVRADKNRRRVILADPCAGLVLDLLEGGSSEHIADRLRQFTDLEKIEIFTIDMCKTLRAAILKVRPDAIIIIDLFHIMKVGNQVMDKVRRRLYPAAKEKREPGQRRPRPELFRLRRATLKKNHLKDMKCWFDQKPELRVAYNLKENFLEIFDEETYGGRLRMNSAAARRFYEEWENKLPTKQENEALWKDFKPIRTAMNNWGEYIFNYFDYPYTNMFTEAMNRKLKDILRDARGCLFETLHARIVFGTYLRRLMSIARELEIKAVMPHSNRGRNQQPNAKGKGAAKDKGEERGRSRSPDYRQMILDFTGSKEGDLDTEAQEWGLIA